MSQWTSTNRLAVVSAETSEFVLRAFNGRYGTYDGRQLVNVLADLLGRLRLADVTWTADTYRLPAYVVHYARRSGPPPWPSGVFRFPVTRRLENYTPSSPHYRTPQMVLGNPEFVCDLGAGSAPTPKFFER